ncbi:unnamed protein product [Durusdinium trenchii]|uniref:Uncharacterized protein n=1 Tax=Durusdinium trenchii TaxID=1381693 RepID=A0ABP0KLM8_9DINO
MIQSLLQIEGVFGGGSFTYLGSSLDVLSVMFNPRTLIVCRHVRQRFPPRVWYSVGLPRFDRKGGELRLDAQALSWPTSSRVWSVLSAAQLRFSGTRFCACK